MTPDDLGHEGGRRIQVSGYDDLHEIGRGGHAVVYRARQGAFDRVVALKVLARMDIDGQALKRFERECKAAGALSWHPHIVAVYDAGTTDDGMPYLAMEYLEAGSFADRLDRAGPLPSSAALSLGVQVAGALETAHGAGTLHRDIKPENVLIGPFGEAKLGDFGIAALQKDPATLTSAGLVTATIAHAAPELFTGGRASVASDIYSLGSTLFALLSGRPAFLEPTDEVVAAAILRLTTGPLPDLRVHAVPDRLARLVEWAMAKDPANRPARASDFGQAMQAMQRDTGEPITDMRLRGAPAAVGVSSAAGDDPSDTVVVNAGFSPPVAPPGAAPGMAPPVTVPPVAPPPLAPPPLAPPPAPPSTPSGFAEPAPPAHTPPPARERRGGRLTLLAVVVAVVAAIATVALARGGGDGGEPAAESDVATAAETETSPPVDPATTAPDAEPAAPEFLDVVAVSASSTAPPGFEASGAIVTYDAENTRDGLADTAWRAPGDGTGVTLTLQLPGRAEITEISLLPGYAKVDPSDGTNRFFQNRRIVRAQFVFDGGDAVVAALADEPKLQPTAIGRVPTSSITIEILETTDDPDRDFTAISEIEVYGVPL